MIWEQPLVKEENLRFRTPYLYPVKQTKTHSVTSYILQCIVCFLLGCELSTGKFYNIGELKFVLSPGYRLRSERLLKKHIMEGLTLQIIGPRVRGFIILNKLRVTLGRFLMWENMVVSNLCQRNSALLSQRYTNNTYSWNSMLETGYSQFYGKFAIYTCSYSHFIVSTDQSICIGKFLALSSCTKDVQVW